MRSMLTALLTASLVLGLAGLAVGQTCPDIQGLTGCAPSPLDGQLVTVTGTVYVVAGTYNSGSVYFQCGSGGGLTFFESGATAEEGDVIEVTGTVGAFGSEIQLNGAMWSVVGTNAAEPTNVATSVLAGGGDFIGDFMRVTGVLAHVSTGFNSIYTVDDGSGPVIVFVDGTTGIDTTVWDLYVGDLVSVIGSTKCFNGEGEILPRRDEDLQLVTIPIETDSWSAVKTRF